MKSLMKMIRQFGESLITLIVSIILFLFNAVKFIVSLPARFVGYIREFLADTDSVLKESLIALSICAVGDLCAGIILGNMEFFLETYPGLMVIIPGAIGMRGNIFGSFVHYLDYGPFSLAWSYCKGHLHNIQFPKHKPF